MNKILILGGTGFLGFHFAKYCLKKKFIVLSLSRNKPKKNKIHNKVKYIYADITKNKILQKKLNQQKKINFVVNFSGEVDHSKNKQVLQTHYKGLKNLTNYFLKKKITKFIQIGSSLEYGRSRSPHTESLKLKPMSIYSNAKALSTKYLLKKFGSHQFPVSIVRPYQIYGPYQDANRLIPHVIINSLKNKSFPCSSGNQLRDFLHIDDFVKILFKLLVSKNTNGEIYNIGFGKPVKIKRIIKNIQKIILKGKPVFNKIKLRKEENIITYPDIEKITKLTKIKPKISLKNGLNSTISFYKKLIKI